MNTTFSRQWINDLREALHLRIDEGYCPTCSAIEIIEDNQTGLLSDALKAAGNDPEELLSDLIFLRQIAEANSILMSGCIDAVLEMFPELVPDEELEEN
jgi:hypothetical protein